MPTLEEHYQNLLRANPYNEPMLLEWMAKVFYPNADWLRHRTTHHNGGARKGALAAAGLAGRMARKGYLKRYVDMSEFCPCTLSQWKLVKPLTTNQTPDNN